MTPLPPSYVLVTIECEWAIITSILSVGSLVKFTAGAPPSAVPNAAIEALRDRERKVVVKPGQIVNAAPSALSPARSRIRSR
jgi:hypothetical protein